MQKHIANKFNRTTCIAGTACSFADALETSWRSLMPQTKISRRDLHAVIYVRGYRRRLLKDC